MQRARVDRSTSPATIDLPREYNAAVEFIDANLAKGRADKTAFIDASGSCTYGELAERVNRAGNALRALGAGMETRVLMCMVDDIDFPAVFWGAIKTGCVPVPINTLLTSNDYAHLLRDSRARIVVVSDALLDRFGPALADQPHVEHVMVAGGEARGNAQTAAGTGAAGRPEAAAATGGPARHRWRVCSMPRHPGSTPRPPPATTSRSGSTPPAPPARRRARCTCIATWSPPPCTTAWRPSESGRTISSTPPPSSSSPTDSATA